jgi:hypothetical protein
MVYPRICLGRMKINPSPGYDSNLGTPGQEEYVEHDKNITSIQGH